MSSRTVKDAAGRIWACSQEDTKVDAEQAREGRDVRIFCTTPSVVGPVGLTVGWQWATMADNGLGRLIAQASPVPRK